MRCRLAKLLVLTASLVEANGSHRGVLRARGFDLLVLGLGSLMVLRAASHVHQTILGDLRLIANLHGRGLGRVDRDGLRRAARVTRLVEDVRATACLFHQLHVVVLLRLKLLVGRQ